MSAQKISQAAAIKSALVLLKEAMAMSRAGARRKEVLAVVLMAMMALEAAP